jgi:N6-L-threonylcarbamoyladenine synthase
MIILGIETSCDETGVCLIEVKEGENNTEIKVLGNQLYSQIKIHEQYGGVFPMMAKREHAKNLVPLLEACLKEAELIVESRLYQVDSTDKNQSTIYYLQTTKSILEREPELFLELKKLLEKIEKPNIDAIAVTNGPGLEPALWVGVTFAKALAKVWNIKVIPTNHMEGHILAATLRPVISSQYKVDSIDSSPIPSTIYHLQSTNYPAIALLISGGHTQLVLIKENLNYEIIGNTCDDALGEAYDKVARMLGLPYPGGKIISDLAQKEEIEFPDKKTIYPLPRPMIKSKDLNFSFSGLKTAVLYTLKTIDKVTEEIKQEISLEFERAVTDVLKSKTEQAIFEYNPETLIIGGGVSANTRIRNELKEVSNKHQMDFLLPDISASTDNALMIALAGYINIKAGKQTTADFKAEGNLSL